MSFRLPYFTKRTVREVVKIPKWAAEAELERIEKRLQQEDLPREEREFLEWTKQFLNSLIKEARGDEVVLRDYEVEEVKPLYDTGIEIHCIFCGNYISSEKGYKFSLEDLKSGITCPRCGAVYKAVLQSTHWHLYVTSPLNKKES